MNTGTYEETEVLATYEGSINGCKAEIDVYVREEAAPLRILYRARAIFYMLPRPGEGQMRYPLPTAKHTAFKMEFLPSSQRSQAQALEHAHNCITILGFEAKVPPPVGFDTQEEAREAAVALDAQFEEDSNMRGKFSFHGGAAPDVMTGRFNLYARPKWPHGITLSAVEINKVRRPVTTMPYRQERS